MGNKDIERHYQVDQLLDAICFLKDDPNDESLKNLAIYRREQIIKQLKALDIIKSWLSKRIVCFDEDVVVIRLKKDWVYNLNDTLYYYVVSEDEKEQIRLLKEVLCDDKKGN